ncbi:MAG: S8 family serine peptidase, partial [Chloroflexales bacterium]|nr:S8 family serine peptidase [Chloroflexales bacterium]
MSPRTARSIAAAISLTLAFSFIAATAHPPRAVTRTQLDISAFRELAQTTARASWARQPVGAPGARLTALVQLELPPLAIVGKGWGQQQRADYAAELAAAQEQLATSVAAMGGSVLARFSHATAGLAVAVDTPDDIAALGALPGVIAVTRVGDYATSQSTAAAVATQAEVAALIGADEVRRLGNDGAGIEIAVIDTGVDYTHRKLGGSGDPVAYRRAACNNPNLSPGDTGCDATQPPPADLFPNAKVLGGLDLVGDVWPSPDPRCGVQQICAFPDLNPIDLNGHGTHVADIAAGLPASPGGSDIGVAPGAYIWSFKACNGVANLCDGVALLSAIDAALDLDRSDSGWCAANCRPYDPADVIVLALSFSYGQPEDAVTLFANLAGFYGSLVVTAAGNDGDKPYIIASPATADASLAVAESVIPGTAGADEAIAADASRGPRIVDNALKPDLAAPGAILSALAGGGSAVAPFGGSSGAAPVAAGVAALIIQELEEHGELNSDPGLADDTGLNLSLGPLVKAVLMNNAFGGLRTATGGLAPYTLQGAGRISALGTFVGRTLALDATAMIALLASTPDLQRCTVTPYTDLLRYQSAGIPPPCAALYPSGEPLYRAWNAQTGSVSFGYRPTVTAQELTRQVVVQNYSRLPRSYSLSTALRFADDQGRGVALRVTPESLSLDGGAAEIVTLTLAISPEGLRDWTLNGGDLGDRGSASCNSPTPELDCPSLTLFEVDGALLIDGGANNQVSVPVHVLPHKGAEVSVSRSLEDRIILDNGAAFKAGVVEPFALVDISPNKCDTRTGTCTSVDYTPGDVPGLAASPIDINYVGLRSYASPGLNANLGLPPAPAGALADEVVAFAITVHDKPYRASPNFPVQFEVHIDADDDGTIDYVVFNADRGDGRDGRNAVFVRDVDAIDGTLAPPSYFNTVADFNTQSWVLRVPATAVGLQSNRPFRFYVRALDTYFRTSGAATPWDCSPGSATGQPCGSATHTEIGRA